MLWLTVEGNASGDSSEANKCSPHLVNSNLAISSAALCIGSLLKRRLEAESEEHHDKSCDKLADTLHGKDGSHHGTSPLGSSEPENK